MLSGVLFVSLLFVAGVLVGIFLTFACIKLSLILPMISPKPAQQSSSKKQKQQSQSRWHPGFLTPPGGGIDMGGPGMKYDSPDDFDPIDPKEEAKSARLGLGR